MPSADLSDLAVPSSLGYLAGFLPPAPARVVEIGCGRGALAAALIAAGYDLTGVEPDPDAADTARSRGVRVLGCPIEDCAPGDRPYDVALFTRSLHHGTDLDGCLGAAARLLRAGGRIVIEEFAREDADLAAAGFVDDSLALLEAAGLARPRSSGQTDPDADPLLRWNIERGPAAPVPLHTGVDMLTSLQRLGEPIGTCRTPSLWRLVLARLTADAPRPGAIAAALRAIETRRIREGSLPEIGLISAVVTF